MSSRNLAVMSIERFLRVEEYRLSREAPTPARSRRNAEPGSSAGRITAEASRVGGAPARGR